jgi:hypothetical protein
MKKQSNRLAEHTGSVRALSADEVRNPASRASLHLTRASIALRCVTGPTEPVAEATARELSRFAIAIDSMASAMNPPG